MDQGIAQILVAIIGLLAPIIQEIIKRKKPGLGTNGIQGSGNNLLQGKAILLKGNKFLRLLDLSIILLYASFFSALLTDSLLISGRVPTLSIFVIIKILFITFCTTFTLFLGWYWGRSEFIVGILSITTLIVLILSPGGVLSPVNQGEAGLTLIFPVFVLIMLASSSAIYSFGNPLAKGISPHLRNQMIVFMVVLLVLSCLTLGLQFISDVSKDERTPKFTGNTEELRQAEHVLSETGKKSLFQRGLFYKLASETVLNSYYRDSFFQVLLSPDFTFINTNHSPNTTNKDSKEKVSATPNSTRNNTPEKNRSRFTEPLSNLTFEKSNSSRARLLNVLSQYLSKLALRQRSYLSDRLLWVHPTVQTDNTQLNLDLPGNDAKTRFLTITKYRIIYALLGLQNLLQRFFSLFNYSTYSTEVYDAFNLKPDFQAEFGKIKMSIKDGERKSSPLEYLPSKPNKLFPDFSPQPYTDVLRQQLALPQPDELFLTYSMYKNLAPFSIPSSPGIKKVQEAIVEFEELKPENQRAFIEYIIDVKDANVNSAILTKIADANKPIPDLNGSTSTALELASLINPGSNTETLSDASRVSTEEIKKAAAILNDIFKTDADSKEKFVHLLQNENPQIPLNYLLNEPTFSFLRKIKTTLPETQRKTLFSLLKDPITPTIQQIANTLPTYNKEKGWLEPLLENFIRLTPKNKEGILNHLAIATYRAQGAYSLEPLGLLIFQAKSFSYLLAFICATILMLPVVLSAILFGGFWGYKLVERDRTQVLIAAESSNLEGLSNRHKLGIPVELQGRQDFLEKLRKLSSRGWSTIGIVGRRGIGKSRVLYELYQPTSGTPQDYAVRVWLSVPSQYQEDDFIETTLEQLALNTEKVVARYLKAEPLVVRRLEALLVQSGLVVFIIASLILVIMLSIIYQRLSRPEVMITWFPIILIFVVSIICLITHITHMQPLDLTPWLESDRTHSPHTVLLYRRVQEVFKYIQSRKAGVTSLSEFIAGQRIMTAIIAGVIGAIVSFLITAIVPERLAFIIFWLLFILISFSLFTVISLYKGGGKETATKQRTSLMSLITEYRDFATTIIYRLEKGALGEVPSNIMICIDELDKIIELDDIRNFLRRMKGIFEVPGVYYYLSLSEDALAALYLGAAEGKNEVDSSLDHIVRIPPLSWTESEQVTTAYLKRRQAPQFDSKIIDFLVVESFGIPRDILRFCDLVMARKDSATVTSKLLAYEVRIEQIQMGAEVYGWSKQLCNTMKGDALQSARDVRKILEDISKDNPPKHRELRVLLLIWIFCGVEFANDLEDSQYQDFLKRLHDIGYRLTFNQPSDLLNEVNELDATFLPQTP